MSVGLQVKLIQIHLLVTVPGVGLVENGEEGLHAIESMGSSGRVLFSIFSNASDQKWLQVHLQPSCFICL